VEGRKLSHMQLKGDGLSKIFGPHASELAEALDPSTKDIVMPKLTMLTA
jgi:hypothetical protein